MTSNKTLVFGSLFLLPLMVILSQCYTGTVKKEDPRGQIFAGSSTCVNCHKDVYDSYIQTAHFETSRVADIKTIHGSFAEGRNVFSFGNGNKVVMQKGANGLYQVGYINGKQTRREKFDITVGGIKAETYLYWKGKQLFELPISYFNALHSWTNSPGYDTGRVDFNRPILRRCMECHSSYIKPVSQEDISLTNRKVEFDKASVILGIDCERCHGPAANHVNYHTEYPEVKKPMYITTYNSLTREQKLDACAVCHSGNKDVFVRSAFVFKMGDTLSKFKEHNFAPQTTDPKTLDVHGNQNNLLRASKCFISSNMDCNTCHNVHKKENGDLAAYSRKCISCHNTTNHNSCKMLPELGEAIKTNCIDCHMPAKPSNLIQVEATSHKLKIPYLVRTHRIAIYPAETEKVINFIKNSR
ncbi:multiheme c-type cytochrome [Mucilaginibacter segetis]|uniref:Cytochrome c554/c'-like protein n=1 Tax=Mucilaginibacter segetis TaxID=2793071 RepID=A0A934UL45_9SPHI|nr:multiheme c-type cytochrome [Mucilaginibacter segetis]MBK0377964.1 hypothetical protein [Mucilaginibacter segetis]